MKSIIITLSIFAITIASYAQMPQVQEVIKPSGKTTLVVDYFTFSPQVRQNDADILRSFVLETCNKYPRINVIDANTYQDLECRNGYYGAYDNNNSRYNAMLDLGAKYVMQAYINQIDAYIEGRESDRRDSPEQWRGRALYTITLTDISTGKILVTKKYDDIRFGISGKNPQEAVVNTLGTVKTRISAIIQNDINMIGQILQVIDIKKNEAKHVYINNGTTQGATKNQKYDVYSIVEIAGKEAQNKIGEIKIKEVSGDELSIAEVKKGGEQILSAMQNGQVLKIVSKEGNLWDVLTE